MKEKQDDDRRVALWLDRIEDQFESGDLDGCWRQLRAAREMHPDDLQLLEWEGILHFEQGQFESALEIQDQVLALQSDRWSTILERAHTLIELGRFDDALVGLERVEKDFTSHLFVPEAARLSFGKALCFDRLGKCEDADAEFHRASAMMPDTYPRVPRMTREEFEDIVRAAFESLPEEFFPYLGQVMVQIDDYPNESQSRVDPFLLGLYEGVPRPERGSDLEGYLDRIYLFKRNLEIEFPEPDRLIDETRKTIVHEVAHHFGLGEEDMGDYA